MSDTDDADPVARAMEIVEGKAAELKEGVRADAERMLKGREACFDCTPVAPGAMRRLAVVYHPLCGHYVCRDHLHHDCGTRG